MLTLTRTTAPTVEPLTLSDAKSHLRVDSSDDDVLITGLIQGAREYVEEITRRALITQTWELSLDDFPMSKLVDLPWSEYLDFRTRTILLPRPPLQSVISVQYVDTDGSTQTLATSVYRVDTKSEPARLTEQESETWPTTDNVTNAVTVTYDAGYGDNAEDVPMPVRQAMKLLIGHWYEHRESVLVGSIQTTYSQAVDALLSPYRVFL